MSEKQTPENQGGKIAIIVIGVVLVLIGLSNLGNAIGLSRFLRMFNYSYTSLREWMLAIGALTAGILLIVFASRGGTSFHLPSRGERLYRSRQDKMIAGVAGGLAHYLGMDPTIMRLAIVALGLLTEFWPVFVVYIAAAIIVPLEPEQPAVGVPPQAPPSAPNVPTPPPGDSGGAQ